jgi:hypothetical protein
MGSGLKSRYVDFEYIGVGIARRVLLYETLSSF